MAHLEKLRSSIEKVGLIQPIGVREKHSRYQIVSGFRRVSVCQELDGMKSKQGSSLRARMISACSRCRFTTTSRPGDSTRSSGDRFGQARFSLSDRSTPGHRNVLALILTRDQREDTQHLPVPCLDGRRDEEYIVREEVSRSNIRRLASMTSKIALPRSHSFRLSNWERIG